MKQPIRFLGLTLNSDEQSVNNGELSQCANVELHAGTLRPSVINGTSIAGGATLGGSYQISEHVTITRNGKLLFVHKTPSYTHYIASNISNDGNNNKLFHAVVAEGGSSYDIQDFLGNAPTAEGIVDIKAIGNTLVILYDSETVKGLHYFVWKEGAYFHLGQKPPFVKLEFTINNFNTYYDPETHPERSYTFTLGQGTVFNTDDLNKGKSVCSIKEEYRSYFSERAYAILNKAHSDIVEANWFYAPFWVRYCYRLYDGTCFMHSAPVLMPVGIPRQDVICITGLEFQTPSGESGGIIARINDGSYAPNKIWIQGTAAILYYKYDDAGGEWASLSDWSDIVSSLDVYISPQIVTTKQDELFKTVSHSDICNTDTLIDGIYNTYFFGYPPSLLSSSSQVFANIPSRSEEEIKSEMLSPVFYKVHSFKIGESLPTLNDYFPFECTLKDLTTFEKLKNDDYKTHNTLLRYTDSAGLYFYNRRLHVYGIAEKLFRGFPFETIAPGCSNQDDSFSGAPPLELRRVKKVIVSLYTDDGVKNVEYEQSGNGIKTSSRLLSDIPLFYPDNRARQMVLYCDKKNNLGQYVNVVITIPMVGSATLNGAFTDMDALVSEDIDPFPAVTVKDVVPENNKLYVSDVDNPFYFPASGRKTVGVGDILGVATVTAALSPGQYGYQDLIVFCTDGIWTLTVTKEGTYSEMHTLSREVCGNPKSICQLDQSVLFASNRALSRIVGSSVASVSDMLNGPVVNVTELLPGLASLFASGTYQDAAISTLLAFNTHPLAFFENGSMLYDFANERVFVLPASPSAVASFPVYVLSLRDMAWSTMLFPAIKTFINSYPHPYIQEADGSLMCFDKAYDNGALPSAGSRTSAIVITRTLTFDTVMKVIQGFEQIHNNASEASVYNGPLLVLYGSNDNVTWTEIGHAQRLHMSYLPGHPYRFFRAAVYMKLRSSERYSSLILDIIEKYAKL